MDQSLPVHQPGSALAQLQSELAATEAAVDTQRLVATAAREAYREAAHSWGRLQFVPFETRPETSTLEELQADLIALQETRDLEGERLAKLIEKMRDLRARWHRDNAEFERLQSVMADLKRLGG